MTRLEWSIEGEKQLSRRLRGLENDIKDFSPAFKKSASKLKSIFSRDVFSSRGQVIGEKWKRLSPYTVAQKARQGFPSDPLVRTGKMKNSFTTKYGPREATISNTAEYFKYHQSNKPRSRIPRRVMMKLGNNQKEMVVKEFQNYIRKILAKK